MKQSQMDLRNEEELISNPDSVIENEIIKRESEELQNQGKIDIPFELSPTDVENNAVSYTQVNLS